MNPIVARHAAVTTFPGHIKRRSPQSSGGEDSSSPSLDQPLTSAAESESGPSTEHDRTREHRPPPGPGATGPSDSFSSANKEAPSFRLLARPGQAIERDSGYSKTDIVSLRWWERKGRQDRLS
jgi:hypothetical protein